MTTEERQTRQKALVAKMLISLHELSEVALSPADLALVKTRPCRIVFDDETRMLSVGVTDPETHQIEPVAIIGIDPATPMFGLDILDRPAGERTH